MNSIVKKRKPVVVLDLDDKIPQRVRDRGVVLCQSREDIVKTVRRATHRSVWISFKQSMTDDLLRKMRMFQHRRGRIYGLVTIESPRPKSIPGLTSHFRRLVGTAPDSTFLPLEELLDVLSAPTHEAAGLFIAGVADLESETLALTRGNFRTITAPFSMFQPSQKGTQPDFHRMSLTDYGHTVRLGEYEASSGAILYEVDPEYRRKIRKEQLAEDRTFGASLRRLRIQKKLSRNDFAPLAAKTIARIERNEVKKLHEETLQIIADRLEVEPKEIETY